MPRPKGSKNKPKHKAPAHKPEDTQPAPEAQSSKPQGHGLTVVEEFNPKPDMGKIKPPADSTKVCGCLHQKVMHYGPSTDWCNTGGCSCQAFNEK